MSIPQLQLFRTVNHAVRTIVLTPGHRFETVITIGTAAVFGEIRDRHHGHKVVLSVEGATVAMALARLIQGSLSQGIFYPPMACINRTGIYYSDDEEEFGCFSVNDGKPDIPILVVNFGSGMAIARPFRDILRFYNARNPEEALFRAAGAFITNAEAA